MIKNPDNIISMVDKSNSPYHWTVKDMLKQTLEQIKEGGEMEDVESALLILMPKKGPLKKRIVINVRLSEENAIATLALVQNKWMNDLS
jgi:hypothetical protein